MFMYMYNMNQFEINHSFILTPEDVQLSYCCSVRHVGRCCHGDPGYGGPPHMTVVAS